MFFHSANAGLRAPKVQNLKSRKKRKMFSRCLEGDAVHFPKGWGSCHSNRYNIGLEGVGAGNILWSLRPLGLGCEGLCSIVFGNTV